MKHIAFLMVITSCAVHETTHESTEISAPVVAQARADALWVTLSPAAARAIADAIARGDLAGTAIRVASSSEAEAWRFEGLEPSELSRLLHERFHRCGGFVVHDSQASAEAALDASTDRFAEQHVATTYVVDQHPIVEALLPAVDAVQIHATIAHLSSYTNRYYKNPSGAEAARWLGEQWRALTGERRDVSVELFAHAGFEQPSVIMTIIGDEMPDEVIVLGAHLDSIAGWSPGPNTPAPGADDDASGVASLTEMARVLLASGFRPHRTIKLMGYAGEEAGLLGSSEIAKTFAAEGIHVIGVLQLDMTNYTDGGDDQIVLISDYTNEEQNAFLGTLIDTYVQVPWGHMRCEYACSDHASWTKRGFPASFPFETHDYNPNIHTADDTLEEMVTDATHAATFSRLALAYAIELAKGSMDARPSSAPP